MKRTLIAIALLSPALAVATSNNYVKPHFRADGTYVEGHYRTNPNSTKQDNYSSKGNYNPYTGEEGTVDPYAPKVKPAPSYTPYRAPQTYEYKPYSYPSYDYRKR